MKCKVITLDNKAAGEIALADNVFAVPVRNDILQRMVNYQLAKRRGGNHKTKTMGEVQGSTRKPFRQKGTGRARQGSSRAPQMRGGGTVFGPVVRSHAQKLPKQVRTLALKTALSAKQADGKLVILDKAKIAKPKTKGLAAKLDKLGLTNALIVADAELDGNFVRAASNLPSIDLLPVTGTNVYDILRRDTLVLTKDAAVTLEARLK